MPKFDLLLFVAALSSATHAQTTYRIDEIVAPPGLTVDARDLNDDGMVVGRLYPTFTQSEPFVWANGTLIQLAKPPGAANVVASGIDSAGRIYGYIDIISSGRLQLPVLWQTGQPFALPTLFQGVSQVLVPSPSGTFLTSAIRSFDDPTPGWKNQFGWIDEPDFTNRSGEVPVPYLFDMRVPSVTVLGTVAGSYQSSVFDVSDTGVAVGSVRFGGRNRTIAVRWDPEQGGILLGSGGRLSGQAWAVNAAGTVVGLLRKTDTGDINTDSRMRPAIWSDGLVQELPVPAPFEHGRANDINDLGDIVGSFGASATSSFQTDGAWIYSNGVMTNLDDLLPPGSGWSLTEALKINNAGQILVVEEVGPSLRTALLTPQ